MKWLNPEYKQFCEASIVQYPFDLRQTRIEYWIDVVRDAIELDLLLAPLWHADYAIHYAGVQCDLAKRVKRV